MAENDHTFTFISPYGAIVEVKGHSYQILHSEGKVVQYEVKNHSEKNEVATIPGSWMFVRLSEQYKVHSG